MALGPLVKSALKAGISDLPEDFTIKAQSVPNMLKKIGVKDEELKYADIQLPGEGRITKQQLVEAEANRADTFTETRGEGTFDWVSLPAGQDNPTYKETVYQFQNAGGTASNGMTAAEAEQVFNTLVADPPWQQQEGIFKAIERQDPNFDREAFLDALDSDLEAAKEMLGVQGSRYTSEHFAEAPNYLMHTRTYDDVIDGKKTRVLQEVQSDLHQQARQRGYAGAEATSELTADEAIVLRNFSSEGGEDYFDEAVPILQRHGISPGDEDLPDLVDTLLVSGKGPVSDIPQSPYEKTWLRKGIEREVSKALGEGREQLAIPIKGTGTDKLHRASGVQKWYETQVVSTAKKIAKQHNMDFEVVKGPSQVSDADLKSILTEHANVIKLFNDAATDDSPEAIKAYRTAALKFDARWPAKAHMSADEITDKLGGTQYAVLKPKDGVTPKSFSLYASPAAIGFLAYESLTSGASEEAIRGKMQERGMDEDDITQAMLDAKKIQQAKEAGHSDEEIKSFLGGKEQVLKDEQPATPPIAIDRDVMVKSDAAKQLLSEEQMSAQDLVSRLKVVQPNMATVTRRIRAFGGHNESEAIATQMERNSVQNIVNLAKDKGVDLEWDNGEFFAVTDQGKVKVTPSIWQDLWAEKGELAGAIGGGIAGFRAAIPIAATVKHPIAAGAITLGMSMAGAAAGSAIGTEGDYLYAAMELQEEMSAEIAAHKALTAVEASVIGDIVGLGLFSSVKGGWKVLKRAKDMMLDGNSEGAYQALKETMFLTDDQATDIVRALGDKTTVAGKGPKEQAIAAAAVTEPGGENILKAAGAVDPQAGAAVVQAIDQRAKDLLSTSAKLTDENVGQLLKGELQGYTTAVKDFYQNVKDTAINSPRANAFTFDYDKLAIKPVLETLHKNITDPTLRQKFLYQMENIQSMSGTRTFGDLLELRQLVNEFKFNRRITKQADWKAVNNVLTEIDTAIKHGSDAVLEDPAKWRADYALARKQYSEMKGLEKNVLARLLNRKGVDEKSIVRGLTKYIGALDDTFHEVLVKLPKQTRAKTEGAVIDVLANKYTAGLEGGLRATNFPMLAKDLETITFTSPDARRAKLAVTELAEVFKNDIPLSQATGNIQIPRFQSYLTTDPVVRAKFELASGVFNYIKTLAPGQTQRNLALVRKTAKLLEQPMNSKAMQELMEEAGDKVDVQPLLLKLAEEAAKRGAKQGDSTLPRVRLYGNGKILGAKGSGPEQVIPVHRIATIQQMNEVAEAYGVNPQNKKLLDEMLKKQGFKAVQIGADKVRRIN